MVETILATAPLRRRGRPAILLASVAGIGLAMMAHRSTSRAPIAINDSASVPIGFWQRLPYRASHVTIGTVIGFRPNALAMSYVRPHMPEYVKRMTIQKYVVGLPGQTMCRKGRGFSIDGRLLGYAAMRDSDGNALPDWSGCHVLKPGEYAVFSDRIPNSFDSRYYGAVKSADIRGIYKPLLTW